MGRSVGVAMTQKDEEEFLKFLKETAEIELLLPFSESQDGFSIEKFPDRNIKEEKIKVFIWNKKLGNPPRPKLTANGKYFIEHIHRYPVLEYSSHKFAPWHSFQPIGDPGRIYWSGTKAKSHLYDDKLFEVWYRKISHWIKSNGTERKKIKGYYYMPNTSKWYR